MASEDSEPKRDTQSMGNKISLAAPYSLTYGGMGTQINRGTGADWFGPSNPLRPMAPPDVRGRLYDYQPGYNLSTRPKTESSNGKNISVVTFDMLRSFADAYDLLRIIIETRKDQMARLTWNVAVKKGIKNPDKYEDKIKQIEDFFIRPDKVHFWDDWLRMVLEDLLVLDAPAIHVRRTYGGDLYSLEPVDGSTIKRVIDDWGRTPLPPTAAYQQVLKGYPAVEYTSNELIYKPRNTRTHRVYGFSPVEQIIMTVNIGLRRQAWQLQTFTEGNIPEALIGTPSTWTPDQILAFQDSFDSMLQGNTAERSKARFVPGEISKGYVATDRGELFGPAEEWLARIACFAFSVSPQPFVKMMNRATAETAQETAAEEGLAPLMGWVRSMMNGIIIDLWNEPDLEFKWEDEDELDPDVKSQIIERDQSSGRLTFNEARIEQGLDPFDHPNADRPMFKTATGWEPIFLTPEEEQEKKDMAAQIAGAKGPGKPGEVSPDDEDGGDGPKPPAEGDDTSEDLGKVDHSDASEAQLKAGNYKKGHTQFQGFNISIETPKGGIRKGKDKDDNSWQVTMPVDYGYIKRTTGADGDNVDVFIGPYSDATDVFIIDQHHLDTDEFDEHKVMLGFESGRSAMEAYHNSFSDGKGKDRAAVMIQMSVDRFKKWLKTGDTTTPSFNKSDQGVAKIGHRPFELEKAGKPSSDDIANGGVNVERKFVASREKKLKALFASLLTKAGKNISKQVVAALKSKGLAKADEPEGLDELLNALELSVLMTDQDDIAEFLSEVYGDSGRIALGMVGVENTSDLVKQVYDRAVDWAEDHAANLIGANPDSPYAITDSTRAMLRGTIRDGLAANMSTAEIADSIMDSYAFSEERAELIAYTEVTSANSEGALAGYKEAKEADVGVKKSWLVLEDGCVICSENAAAGQIELDDPFPSGDMAPGAHPKCRCVLVPHVED